MATDSLKIIVKVDGAEQSKQQLNSVSQSMVNMTKVLIGTAGLVGSIALLKKTIDLSDQAAQFQQLSEAMEMQFGGSVSRTLVKLNEFADGTISDMELVQGANRAMALNVTRDLDKMGKLLEFARLRARAMGISTTQAFNDIITGIGRGSPLILDNLGIITKGWDAEAKAAGEAYDVQFILNKVLQQAGDALATTGALTITATEQQSKLDASWKNTKISLGQFYIPYVQKGREELERIIKATTDYLGMTSFGKDADLIRAKAETLEQYKDAQLEELFNAKELLRLQQDDMRGKIAYTEIILEQGEISSKEFLKRDREASHTINKIDEQIEAVNELIATALQAGTIKPIIDIKIEMPELETEDDEGIVVPLKIHDPDLMAFREKVNAENERTAQEIENRWQQAGNIMGNMFYEAIGGNFDNIEEMFNNMLKRMLADLVASGLLMLLTGGASGGTGFFGSGGIFGGLFGSSSPTNITVNPSPVVINFDPIQVSRSAETGDILRNN